MEDIDEYKIALYVLSHGGSVVNRSFYDEEGVEGWEWEYDGHEYNEIGSWEDSPPIPDDLIEYVKSKTNNWQ